MENINNNCFLVNLCLPQRHVFPEHNTNVKSTIFLTQKATTSLGLVIMNITCKVYCLDSQSKMLCYRFIYSDNFDKIMAIGQISTMKIALLCIFLTTTILQVVFPTKELRSGCRNGKYKCLKRVLLFRSRRGLKKDTKKVLQDGKNNLIS